MKIFSSPQAGAHVVSTLVVAGFVILVSVLALHAIAESTLMVTMCGILSQKFGTVVDYYLGSSMGEAVKSAQISHLIGQPGDQPAAPKPEA
jgi:membrane protein YqaA with SNARE-associated domain